MYYEYKEIYNFKNYQTDSFAYLLVSSSMSMCVLYFIMYVCMYVCMYV